MRNPDEYMSEAIRLAKMAAGAGDVPVGCVISGPDGNIVGRGQNRREVNSCATGHAEIEAINEACRTLGTWRLTGCSMYVTLEPCPMCAGAVIMSRISSVYYGAREEQTGSCGSVINLFMENYGQSTKVYGGICENECRELMRVFFKNLRRE